MSKEKLRTLLRTSEGRKKIAAAMTPRQNRVPEHLKETKEELLTRYIKTPKGRAKIAASMKQPILNRVWLESIAKLLTGFIREYPCAYVIENGQVVSVDVPTYPGETLEGEAKLQGYPNIGWAFDRALDLIVTDVKALAADRLLQLLREVPGRPQGIAAPRIDLALDEVYDKLPAFRVVMDGRGYASLVKDQKVRMTERGEPKLLACGCPKPRGPLSYPKTLIVCTRAAAGEVWAFSGHAGFHEIDLELEVLRDRVKWKANLKLGIGDPSLIYQVEVP
jgi:hypothetical protein